MTNQNFLLTSFIEQLVVDGHVVVKEVELSIPLLPHIHLRHPVVGEVIRDVTAAILTNERRVLLGKKTQEVTWYICWSEADQM